MCALGELPDEVGRRLDFSHHGAVWERTWTPARLQLRDRGQFTVDGSFLTLSPDHRPDNPDRYRIRPYEEWYQGKWRHSLALLAGDEPRVIQYFRIDESSR